MKETTWSRAVGFFVFAIAFFFALPKAAGPALSGDEISCATNGWCKSDAFDETIALALIAPNPKAAALISHIINFAICPLLALVSTLLPLYNKQEHRDHAFHDTLMLCAVTLIALGINQTAKIGAKRQRPCFYYGDESITEFDNGNSQEYLSFFSGDATLGCVTATAGVVLAKIRDRVYVSSVHPWTVRVCFFNKWRASPYTLTAILLAFIGSFLRILAFVHWTTDVLMGILCGILCGFVPVVLYTFPSATSTETQALTTGDLEANNRLPAFSSTASR